MIKSQLQIARAAYSPKLPASLKGAVKLVEGEKTASIADQAEIAKLFPNTYGMPIITMAAADSKVERLQTVITSYSIHYTKLYELLFFEIKKAVLHKQHRKSTIFL